VAEFHRTKEALVDFKKIKIQVILDVTVREARSRMYTGHTVMMGKKVDFKLQSGLPTDSLVAGTMFSRQNKISDWETIQTLDNLFGQNLKLEVTPTLPAVDEEGRTLPEPFLLAIVVYGVEKFGSVRKPIKGYKIPWLTDVERNLFTPRSQFMRYLLWLNGLEFPKDLD
jgi:hypothetical protein